MKLYAVVDRKAKECISVFASINDSTAKRSFLSLLATPRSFYNDFYKDFSLYHCADVAFENGSLVISQSGNETLSQHGFKVNTFSEVEPVMMGVDVDHEELTRIYESRFPIPENVKLQKKVGDTV